MCGSHNSLSGSTWYIACCKKKWSRMTSFFYSMQYTSSIYVKSYVMKLYDYSIYCMLFKISLQDISNLHYILFTYFRVIDFFHKLRKSDFCWKKNIFCTELLWIKRCKLVGILIRKAHLSINSVKWDLAVNISHSG